ncbi:MAG: histidine kinase [Eubacterium sp.]|nr:histidine kinase [Eubacterium sp.]
MRQRMLLVYAVGCFLPLILVSIYMFNSERKSLANIQTENENRKLEERKELIESTMDHAIELSERIYFEPQSQKIGITGIGSDNDILVDYRGFDKLSEYIGGYYKNISSICIYVNKGTVDRVDNRYFRLITDTIREKNWYKKTIENDGLPSWSYLTNLGTGRRSIRLTKILYTKQRNMAGIISISIDPALTNDIVSELDGFAVMMLNGSEVVHSNFDITEEEAEYISEASEDKEFTFRGSKCYRAGVSINPRYSQDQYDIISIRSYDDIDDQVMGSARRMVLPMFIAMIVMAIAITILNSWFSRRIMALGKAMHNVTEKKYDDVKRTGIGDAKDEIWDLYNDMNKMVTDMQQLSDAAAAERLQKEQLYSREKEVEFKMLATQINPHFLYNTLENIRMLAAINKEKEIEDISVRLTRLLRSSLEVGNELKTLAWEMDKVDCYLGIQDYRFGDRITSAINFDKKAAENYLIMPFVVQPFVENAYVHAMEEMEEGGRIDITANISDAMYLVIEDNGHGMTEEELQSILTDMNDFENLDRTHIGVVNVNQRIKLRFGEDYGVRISSTYGHGTKVEIRMPLIEA